MNREKIQRAIDTLYRLQGCVGHDACECDGCAYYNSWENMDELEEVIDWLLKGLKEVSQDGRG